MVNESTISLLVFSMVVNMIVAAMALFLSIGFYLKYRSLHNEVVERLAEYLEKQNKGVIKNG